MKIQNINKLSLIFFLLGMSQTLYSKNLKTDMHEMASKIVELQKYSLSADQFMSSSNEATIGRLLDNLESHSTKILKHIETQNSAYRLSGEALTSHFREMNVLYKRGNKIFSRWMANSTTNLCASCHSQLPEVYHHIWSVSTKDLGGKKIDQGEVLFSTWKYDDALKIFDEIIRNFPSKNSSKTAELELALNKKLIIFLRVKRDVLGAIYSFSEDLKNKKLPKTQSDLIKQWLANMKDLQKKIKEDEKMSETKLIGFVAKLYEKESEDDKTMPEKIYASGLLYEALHKRPQDSFTPEFLYWLGVGDSDLNRYFFFGLSQSYLRECVVKYPKSPIAKKCYESYAQAERDQWTGTRGYEPPPGLEEDLRKLEKKMK